MTSSEDNVRRVGFIGLGAMGLGMACNIIKKPHYEVVGYDVYAPSGQKFVDCGGRIEAGPKDVAKRSEFLVCMAANSQQVHEILFNDKTGALQGMDGITILSSKQKLI